MNSCSTTTQKQPGDFPQLQPHPPVGYLIAPNNPPYQSEYAPFVGISYNHPVYVIPSGVRPPVTSVAQPPQLQRQAQHVRPDQVMVPVYQLTENEKFIVISKLECLRVDVFDKIDLLSNFLLNYGGPVHKDMVIKLRALQRLLKLQYDKLPQQIFFFTY
ncbi:hypothetical protein HDU76_006686 [Blyttiomyces sp. JEL0837]|nr:hypothetical protein HDU76_006686 [Blyttiomyces sp. JEL0837]